MAVLPILLAPHPVLKTKAQPVVTITPDLKTLAADMLETMYEAPGIGPHHGPIRTDNRHGL